jgi:hypothetical protein
MEAILISALVIGVFFLGVYLAPVLRNDYGEFKAYVEAKLLLAEQKAKTSATSIINKL